MAESKTKATDASVDDFLNACPDEARRADARVLARMMERVTGERPRMWGAALVGFGSYHYRYESGREGDMLVIGFSPRKAASVVYGATGFAGAEALLARLGRHTLGKGCLYLKKLADVDLAALEDLLKQAVAARKAR